MLMEKNLLKLYDFDELAASVVVKNMDQLRKFRTYKKKLITEN